MRLLRCSLIFRDSVFSGASGSFMVPLLSGPVPVDILSAKQPMRYMMDKAKSKHPSYRVLEGASVVIAFAVGWCSGYRPPCTLCICFRYFPIFPMWRAL